MSQDVSQDVYLTLTTDLTALIDELGQLQLGCLVRKQGELARRVTPMLARAEACLGALREKPMQEPRPTVERVGDVWVIRIVKGVLVLTNTQLVGALARGKRWQRWEQRQQREIPR